MASSTPNTTLYIKNLNDKVNKEELRSQLFGLFMTYGKVIDVVALKSKKMRGQAFLVFTDLTEATAALRACEGMIFYDKPLHIEYAKSKSFATLKREDPNYVPPNATHPASKAQVQTSLNGSVAAGEKRTRDEESSEGTRQSKREKNDDDEEMELDDDDDDDNSQKEPSKSSATPESAQPPSARLLCTNLPQEVTDDVLSVLFQQYQGFQTTHVVPASTPNASGVKVKIAQVQFDTPELASVAKEALDGFTLKKGWTMSVAYV